jgi:dTDP-4-amino-4,6-dideoxygalactose transaminase
LNYKENDFPVAEEASNCVLSLPMNAFLTDDDISYISKILNNI